MGKKHLTHMSMAFPLDTYLVIFVVDVAGCEQQSESLHLPFLAPVKYTFVIIRNHCIWFLVNKPAHYRPTATTTTTSWRFWAGLCKEMSGLGWHLCTTVFTFFPLALLLPHCELMALIQLPFPIWGLSVSLGQYIYSTPLLSKCCSIFAKLPCTITVCFCLCF